MEQLYPESMEEAAQIARAALPLASKHKLPANPVNYAVFYEYVAGHNPGLCEAANEALQHTSQLTQELVTELYKHYLDQGDDETLLQVRGELKKIMRGALGTLVKADEQTASYQDSLNKGVDQLDKELDVSEIRQVVEQVVKATEKSMASGEQLQKQLIAANNELETLREDFERARSEALIDPLTGINNRRCFDKHLQEMYAKTQENNESLCLLMIDIDHFKKVNDTFGHVVGDEVIKYVARCISDCVRGSDIEARYGGEEFSVLLPDTPLKGARKVGESICNKIRSNPLRQKSTEKSIGTITVSIGVARLKPEEPTDLFVSRADVALYQAKGGGRDRVCWDEDIDY